MESKYFKTDKVVRGTRVVLKETRNLIQEEDG